MRRGKLEPGELARRAATVPATLAVLAAGLGLGALLAEVHPHAAAGRGAAPVRRDAVEADSVVLARPIREHRRGAAAGGGARRSAQDTAMPAPRLRC